MAEMQNWGRDNRRMRRETARALAKELMHSGAPHKSNLHVVLWCLETFMTLCLLLLAPKIGRGGTAMILTAMGVCLVYPIWHLSIVQAAPGTLWRWVRFSGLLLAGAASVVLFGLYVWPPIKRHALSAKERTSFVDVLKEEKGGDEGLEVHIACPSGDEQACIYAGQFIQLFGKAGWQIEPSVERVVLAKASDGITALRKAGNKEYMMKHWDSGGYVAINEAHLLAVQKAFQTIHIEIDSGANPDLAQNIMMLYVGPEREDESYATNLTKSTEWVTGKHEGPFPRRE
jgi:hypothetical protein